MIGKKLSHYKVIEKIGQGGMGTVYRATDTKLNRDVALKILPQQFASDSQRMARFQREAEVLASLDHPNIGQIYGIEEAGQIKALVLQLIEGPTLAERIAQGPIPVEETLKIALQIAEGLEAAHEKGVIHRDLKPANIKITPEGQVKILDFGLAKALEGETPPASNLSQSPTLTAAATQAGVILGTAAYMSPEQARGQEADKRTDIWAFGCVLFEMLTRQQVFQGELMSDVMASVLKTEPDYEGLPQSIHPRFRELIRRCLEKDPKRRFRDIGDVGYELQEILLDPHGLNERMLIGDVGQRRTMLPWALATGFALAAIVLGLLLVRDNEPAPTRPVRFSVTVPTGERIVQGATVALSDDGSLLAYSSRRDRMDQLCVRPLAAWDRRCIPEALLRFGRPLIASGGSTRASPTGRRCDYRQASREDPALMCPLTPGARGYPAQCRIARSGVCLDRVGIRSPGHPAKDSDTGRSPFDR